MNFEDERPASGATRLASLIDSLRQRAEAALGQRGYPSPEQFAALSPAEAQQVLNDQSVYQIELELQNEELRRTQAELDSSRARYFDFYDLAPVGFCSVSYSGLILHANLAAAAMLDAPRTSLPGQLVSRFLLPQEQDTWYLLRQKVMESRERQTCQLRLVRQDGAEMWVQLQAISAEDRGGTRHLRIVLNDITELKQTEQDLKFSQQRLELALKGGDLGLWDWQIQSGKVRYSDRWYELLGLPLGDGSLDIESWTKVIHPDDLSLVSETLTAHLIGQTPAYECEHRVRHSDQHWIWLQARGKVVERDKDGNPVRAVGTYMDITERKQLEEQVCKLAFYDGLTELPNRRLLMDRMSQTMGVSKRAGRHCALIFLDMDNFKPLNDTYGHKAGDLLLIEAAKRLTSYVREVDTVSRFGGDEFTVLLGDLVGDKSESISEVRIIAEKIRVKLADPYTLPVSLEGNAVLMVEHRCTASIGAVVFMKNECSHEDIFRRADTAMYKAKKAGRNAVIFYELDEEL